MACRSSSKDQVLRSSGFGAHTITELQKLVSLSASWSFRETPYGVGDFLVVVLRCSAGGCVGMRPWVGRWRFGAIRSADARPVADRLTSGGEAGAGWVAPLRSAEGGQGAPVLERDAPGLDVDEVPSAHLV